MTSSKLKRVGKRFDNFLPGFMQKNGFKTVPEATDAIVDILNGLPKKRKVIRKIIREIEF